MSITANRAAFLFVIAIGSVAANGTARAQPIPEQPRFTKQALDANGAPLTGPVAVGQTIQYVLSYNSGASSLSAVSIDDTLSANLAYVNPSIVAPPGWTWTPGPGPLPPVPYSVGNHETYDNPSVGPGMSFIINVPVGYIGQRALTGGDGTLPIVVGNRLYEIFHHALNGQARINCLELLSLATCAATPGTGTWPRSLDSAANDQRTTPMVVRTALVGTRIYYPSARNDGVNTYFGIGCWETATEAPCAFVDLPGTPSLLGIFQASGAPWSLDNRIAGVVADPANAGRLFMFAIDRVYCVDVTIAGNPSCTAWNPVVVSILSSPSQIFDMISGEAPFANRLYVQYGGPSATVRCLDISLNGARCSPWGSGSTDPVATPNGNYGLLSLVPNGSGAMQAICVHPFYWSVTARLSCFDASNGTSYVMPSNFPAAMNSRPIFAPFHIPGITGMPGTAGRVLYPQGVDSSAPYCFDFGSNAACSPFTAAWPWSSYQDYGYAVDPVQPDRCLLGLGNGATLWRFARDGSFDANGCVKRVEQTFDINSFFCAVKPKLATWGSLLIRNPRPTELAGGTVNLVNSSGTIVKTITILAAPTNTYAVNVPATGANSQLTVQFTPTYAPAAPANGYQLELTFTADVDPQICYQATVMSCGVVSNQATLTGVARERPVKIAANVDLGTATGPMCVPEGAGLLKVCKVAGPGIIVGTHFTFAAGNTSFSVPAGPAPGGTCVIGPNFPIGSNISVVETIPPGDTVSSITVLPPNQLIGTPNLAGGSVNVTIGTGVTVVTFTDKRTGFLEICKRGGVRGNFSFTVNPGGLGPFVVPAGACSPPIEVAAGAVLISEMPNPGSIMIGCAAFPAGQQGACNLGAQTSTVTVAAGNVSAETIAFITNRRR